jgi:hypothetical protein
MLKHKIAMLGLTAVVFVLAPRPFAAEGKRPAEIKKGSDEDLITRWKVRKVTIAEAEAGKTKLDKPSGREWKRFVSGILPGDEVWYFCSPRKTWENLMGSRGYAIFRAGKLVDHFTTLEN